LIFHRNIGAASASYLFGFVLWATMIGAFSAVTNALPLIAGAGREIIVSEVGDPIGSWGQKQDSSWSFDNAAATTLFLSYGDKAITIVSFDTILIYDYQTKYIVDRLHALGRPGKVFRVASHTHATPSLLAAGDAIDFRVRNAILSAVLKAQDDAQPAEVGRYIAAFNRIPRASKPTKEVFSICEEDLINGWRAAHPDDPIDDTVSVLRFLSANNAPIATVFNYAAHPVTFGGKHNRWGTLGYPAQARRIIERKSGGLSLFLQGIGGDIDTPCAVLSGTPAHLSMVRFGLGLGSVV